MKMTQKGSHVIASCITWKVFWRLLTSPWKARHNWPQIKKKHLNQKWNLTWWKKYTFMRHGASAHIQKQQLFRQRRLNHNGLGKGWLWDSAPHCRSEFVMSYANHNLYDLLYASLHRSYRASLYHVVLLPLICYCRYLLLLYLIYHT